MNNIEKSRRLRELILAKDTLVMPDAFDPLSARIIERLGFKAVQCSGFSMAVAAVRPSEAELGMEANLNVSRTIVNAVEVPVMADGEDGFGGPEDIVAAIRAYVEADLAGINLEDQVLGQPGSKRIVTRDVMVEKLTNARKAAKDANNADLVINGRTDALAVANDRQAGLKEAVVRANAYLAAGADLAFITSVATMDEVEFLLREIKGPISVAAGMPYNVRTLSLKALKDAGVARVSLPAIAILSVVRAMMDTLQSIRDTGDFTDILDGNRICGMEDIAALLKQNARIPMATKQKVLFLCTGNSCRSQMAEGWARYLKGDAIDAYSAGIESHGLNRLAVKAMAEVGVDISNQRSKLVDELKNLQFDYVVTVCDNANESCPLFPGRTKVVHVGFDDPPRLASNAKTDEEAFSHYRRVRDEIRAFVETLPDGLKEK